MPKSSLPLNFQITQISCYDNVNLAPSGCTQYYQATTGVIQSFNWISGSAATNVQLANQNQKICFRLNHIVFVFKSSSIEIIIKILTFCW